MHLYLVLHLYPTNIRMVHKQTIDILSNEVYTKHIKKRKIILIVFVIKHTQKEYIMLSKIYRRYHTQIDQFHIRGRKKKYEKNQGKVKGIWFHNGMHYVLYFVVKLLRHLHRQKLIVVGDRRTLPLQKESIIYACTHVGGNDVECLIEAIKNPCFIFAGDPKEMYLNLDGLMMALNGSIFLDSFDKEDRYIAKQTAISLLKQGGSLMIFPEGAWNISKNQPVMGLFHGTSEIGILSQAQIIPVAIEHYGKNYYVNIGENIPCKDRKPEEKEALTGQLRDILASLKWEIFERAGMTKRASMAKESWQSFLDEMFVKKELSYSLQDVEDTMFKPRNQTPPKEAFSYLSKLQPRKENAFLTKSTMEYRSNT